MVAAGLPVLLLPLIKLASRRTLAAPATGGIDAHCHVFNASDLPIRGFLRRVVFEDYEDQVTPDALRVPSPIAALIAALATFMSNGVVSAEEEFEQITSGVDAFAGEYDPFSSDAQTKLEDAIHSVMIGTSAHMEFEPGLQVPQESIEALRKEIERELEPGPATTGGDRFTSEPGGVFLATGMVGRHVRWAGWLRAPRLRMVERIVELYGLNQQVTFFTPALVDYSQWLDDTPQSDLASQIAVMEVIQKAAFERFNVFVHCLAPYDPWRQALDEEYGRDPSALDLVRDAVETRGFVGVKLYPPMGFLPSNNLDGNLTYPSGADQLPGFKRKVDGALERIFAWAASEGVAIMSHTTNSQGGGPGYAERANPRGWESVLARHPHLRINLAHFGGFEEELSGETWESTIGGFLSRFPNVFADLSYLSQALPSAPKHHQALVADKMRSFLGKFDPNVEHVIYGSDWIMLGREADHHMYFGALQSLMGRAGISPQQWTNIVRANAIRLYGLRRGDQTRQRLEIWYRKMGLDVANLEQFG